jgi:BASS family bile acid:Na+ symporter
LRAGDCGLNRLRHITDWATKLFVVWVLAAAVAAMVWPSGFRWFAPYIVPALGVIMFGMGITLTPADFKRVAEQPYAVGVGVAAQFVVMPLWAALLAKMLGLPAALAAGLILVGSCPGGTASNVMVYLARGDVALSVTMTSCSTIASVVATPYLMLWLAGEYVPVDATALLRSILMIVIIPVLGGLAVRQFLGARIRKFDAALPIVSVAFIVMIVACIVALAKDNLLKSGPLIFAMVALHNGCGLALGYGLARLAGLDAVRCRTISIEVGMQNSGLGVALASKHFADAIVALPAAIFSVWHNITGPALAGYWSRKPPQEHARTA